MVTVTTTDVTNIYPTTLNVEPFLDIATNMANELLSGKGLSDATMKSVIIYLTAHLLVLSAENGGLRRERMGDADDSYAVPDPKSTGFASTRFGQMAMILDPTGTLASSSSSAGLKAFFEVVDVPSSGVGCS